MRRHTGYPVRQALKGAATGDLVAGGFPTENRFPMPSRAPGDIYCPPGEIPLMEHNTAWTVEV